MLVSGRVKEDAKRCPLDLPAVAVIATLSTHVRFAAGCLWLAWKGREPPDTPVAGHGAKGRPLERPLHPRSHPRQPIRYGALQKREQYGDITRIYRETKPGRRPLKTEAVSSNLVGSARF